MLLASRQILRGIYILQNAGIVDCDWLDFAGMTFDDVAATGITLTMCQFGEKVAPKTHRMAPMLIIFGNDYSLW